MKTKFLWFECPKCSQLLINSENFIRDHNENECMKGKISKPGFAAAKDKIVHGNRKPSLDDYDK